MKAGKIVFGTESTIDMINKNKVKLKTKIDYFLEAVKNNFEIKCKEKNVPLYIFGEKDSLSKAIGKNNKTVLGIKDKNLALAIKKILDGGDVIG